MSATVKGQVVLKGLQHAEQQKILGFFASFAAGFKSGTITLLKFMKVTAMVGAVVVPALSVSYKISGAGFGAVSGKDVFIVPGPEVGTGYSFTVAAFILGCFFLIRKRMSAEG